MKPPTHDEFRIARELADQDTAEGESAYQVCRWYRNEVFYRGEAEVALKKIRRALLAARKAGNKAA